MSVEKKFSKGFDINLAGKPELKLEREVHSTTYAVKPTDFPGIVRSKVLVKEGDQVKAGTPLFFDKNSDSVMYCAPVSGEVVEVKRGAKRAFLELRILADETIAYQEFTKYTVSDIKGLTKESVIDTMLNSGVWPNIVQRPYAVVADPKDSPKGIFISGFDTSPLAPDYGFIFKGMESYFQVGIDILNKFAPNKVHFNINSKAEIPSVFAQVRDVIINKFSGPHPAGNVGVQMHHIDPINKGEVAWTISPFGVIQIGKLFLDGIYDTTKIISVCGSEVKKPAYYKVNSGICVDKLLENNIKSDNVRIISGNVLTGEGIEPTGYLGYYHNQITVIPEGNHHEFFGWILPTTNKLSFHRSFGLLSFMNPNKEYVIDTNTKGQERAFVLTGNFEKVLPMDIYPVHLLKAILAEDYDEMEALGIYEVAEEDLALCEFIDVSKMDVQATLRKGLDMLRIS